MGKLRSRRVYRDRNGKRRRRNENRSSHKKRRFRFKKESGFNHDLVELFTTMRQNQPKEPSFGSCFKNPKGDFAGRLIEAVGLKGVRFGKNKSLCFSEKHANFLVNLGDSTFEEAVELIELARERVRSVYGIALENEVQILQ